MISTVNFGPAFAGLTTVGWRIQRLDGTFLAAKVTAGVIDKGAGVYAADIPSPGLLFKGWLVWDTGGVSPEFLWISLNPPDTSGDGLHQVLVTLASGSMPIPGQPVTIKHTSTGDLVAYGNTDSLGQVSFIVNPGDYQVLIASRPGYSPLAAQPLTVTTGNVSVSYALVPQSVTPPAMPALCRVIARVIGTDGLPKSGVTFKFTLQANKSLEISDTLIAPFEVVRQTDAAGLMQADIIRSDQIQTHTPGDSTQWRIECAECRVDTVRTVNVPTLDLGVLLT